MAVSLANRPIPIDKTMMHKKSALSERGAACVRHYECLFRIILQLSSEIKANGFARIKTMRRKPKTLKISVCIFFFL